VDPMIDFAWQRLRGVTSSHRAAQQHAGELLFSRASDADFLDACQTDPAVVHPLIQHPDLSEFLSGDERAAFARELLNRPVLIGRMSLGDVMRFYRAFRWGAASESLQIVSQWCEQNANLEPVLDDSNGTWFGFHRGEFVDKNRDPFRWLPMFIAFQHEGQSAQFEEDALVGVDGTCSLPAAYFLAYCHLLRGDIEGWIEMLDAHLEDETISGDAKVNWLIARAQAEEIRRGKPDLHTLSFERSLAGKQWLEEASLVAVSENAKRRAAYEIFARHALLGEYDAATSLLDRVATSLVEPESTQAIQTWRTQLESLRQARLAAKALRAAQRNERTRARLEERLQGLSSAQAAQESQSLDALMLTLESIQ
ncbi:MAG: hypothetical protein KDA60_10510, partial [Planctomycetales bacterium]|nr:hypothetical protein [Planctomycetales bacterium]